MTELQFWGVILAALIGGICSVAGVIITTNKHAADMDAKLDKHQAVMDTKLENLTDEVHKHNNFAQKIPVLESRVDRNESDVRDLRGRVQKLEMTK